MVDTRKVGERLVFGAPVRHVVTVESQVNGPVYVRFTEADYQDVVASLSSIAYAFASQVNGAASVTAGQDAIQLLRQAIASIERNTHADLLRGVNARRSE